MTNSSTSKPERRTPTWSALQRLHYIEERLFWDGRINRANLIEAFGVSIPQATLDFREYLDCAPGNMAYDKKQKCYFATPEFTAAFISPSAENYLRDLTIDEPGKPNSCLHPAKDAPPFDILPTLDRRVDSFVLRSVLQAINSKLAIEVKYQSISSALPAWRWIEPHALASDGLRWHIRAYCQLKAEFRDFVLGRITEIRQLRPATTVSADDMEWNEHLRVVIAANPSLTLAQQRIIEKDYSMSNGRVELVVRRSLLFYLKRRLNVDEGVDKPAAAQQVVIIDIVPITGNLK